MNKKAYIAPSLEITTWTNSDVITTSGVNSVAYTGDLTTNSSSSTISIDYVTEWTNKN